MQLLPNRGVTVVEVLVGVAIFSLVVIFMAQTLGLFFSNASLVRERTKATFLAAEAQEMVRFVRDDNWNTLAAQTLGTAYALDATAGSITLTATPEVIDGAYTRTVRFTSVYRNASDDIVVSTAPGAAIDPGSRFVTVTVTWGTGESVVLEALVTNIFDV